MNELQLLSLGYVLFVVLIAGELAWSKYRNDGGYRLGEFVVNIGHGAVFQVFDGFTKALVLVPFLFVAQFSVFELPLDTVWGWFLGLLVYDFASYWKHRHHHEIGFLWAVHGVHHAASDFNFAAALRQALFQNVTGWLWWAPLAFVMPLEMFIGLAVFDYLYQFVQHTRYVPKLGPIEWVMNTPSHHRVHHGTEPEYLDKNYGGILIIWDRMFGTFAEEQQEPVYGLTKPLNDLNPVWGNFALWVDLFRASEGRSLADRLKVFFGGPEMLDRVAPGVVERDYAPMENAEIPASRLRYVAISYVGLPLLLGALAWVPESQMGLRIGLGVLLIASTLTPGGLLEQRVWAKPLEGARMALAAVLAGFAWGNPVVFAAVVLAIVGNVVALASVGALGLVSREVREEPRSAAEPA